LWFAAMTRARRMEAAFRRASIRIGGRVIVELKTVISARAGWTEDSPPNRKRRLLIVITDGGLILDLPPERAGSGAIKSIQSEADDVRVAKPHRRGIIRWSARRAGRPGDDAALQGGCPCGQPGSRYRRLVRRPSRHREMRLRSRADAIRPYGAERVTGSRA